MLKTLTLYPLPSLVSSGKLILKLLGSSKKREEKKKKVWFAFMFISVWWCLCIVEVRMLIVHTCLLENVSDPFLRSGIFFLNVTDQMKNQFSVKSFIHALGGLLMVHQMANNCSHMRFRFLSREDDRKK